MKLLTRNGVAIIFAFVLFGSIAFFSVMNVLPLFGDITKEQSSTEGLYRTYRFFATSTAQTVYATTTTATSTNITAYFDADGRRDDGSFVIAGAKKAMVRFTRGDTSGQGNTGGTVFKIQTTRDGTNWDDFKLLVQSTSTTISNTGVQATASTTAGGSTTTLMYGLDLDYTTYYAIRCIVVESVDGEHSCEAAASW